MFPVKHHVWRRDFLNWHDGVSDCVSRVSPHEPAYCKALMFHWRCRTDIDLAVCLIQLPPSLPCSLPAGKKRRFAVDGLMRALTLKTVFEQVNPMILLAMDHE